MKKQNNSGQLSNFHLQLYALQEREASIKAQPQREQRSFLYRIDYLPISISITSSILYFSFFLLWPLLLIDSYQKAYAAVYAPSITPLLNSFTSPLFSISILGYVINGLLLGTIGITLVFQSESAGSGVVYFFWYLGSRMLKYVRYMIQGLLFLAGYFAFSSMDALSIIIFVLAVLVACFYTAILQNITLRKDEFCCKSLEFSCLHRLVLASSLTICIISNQITSTAQLAGNVVGQLVLAGVLMGCYFSFGLTTYRHRVGRLSLFSMVTLYFCLSLAMLFDLLATSYYSYSWSNLGLIGTAMVIVGGFLLISLVERVRRVSTNPSCMDIRRKVFFAFNKYEQADEDQQVDCEIRGIMHEHYTRGCRNPECIANLQQCYDSKKKKKCSITKIAQGKVSVIKFFVKCLYETALDEKQDDVHLQLDYLEFYYLKLKNIFTVLVRMAKLEQRYLTFYQRLRLIRIKDYLTQQSNQFSKDLYHRSLSMCAIIRSQQTFVRIQQLIEVVLGRNELFWRYLSFNEVQLREIVKIAHPNFQLLQLISSMWNQINHYFPINRRWKFYYICFTVFVRNEKVKPAMIEDFGNSVEYDSIFKTDNYFVDKTTEKELLYNSIMLFQQNTCFLHAKCDEEKMVITRVSNFFQRNLDYEPQEIIGSSLNQIMPQSIRAFHHPMFLAWVKDGRSNNEAYYEIKKIYPITKRGYLYPCFKFYKRYIQINGDVEYIAMLKSNRQDEQLMLINADFQIEGITLSLHHKLKLRTGDYLYLKGINILALMPMLAKYTRFCSSIHDDDEDFLQSDDNQNYFKRQGTIIKGKGDQNNQQTNILHERKQLNLANIKLFLPNDFQATLDYYKQLTNVKKLPPFDAIRELYHWIRKEKNFLKFKTQICIRQKQTIDHRYFEIQINELQENNRLEKLRMGEMEEQSAIDGESSREIEENRLNEIDMQLFFSMSKKKNKVVLFPSKNIFLKDENNRALKQIAHINNINIFIRLSLLIFLSLVLAELLIQMSMVNTFTTLTNQYYQISRHEKVAFMLNTQYSIQHIQPGNSWEQSFTIIAYTHTLLDNYESIYFQSLIFDTQLNQPGTYQPYYQYLPNNMSGRLQPSYDQFSIFFEYFQRAISLHREAQQYPQSRLDNIDYYQFNNYMFSFHRKCEEIKAKIRTSFNQNYLKLKQIDLIFAIVIAVIVVGCLLFSLSRFWKVSNGFRELVSILIQIDSNDMREISKYVDYTHYLFEHLNEKNQRMSLQNDTQYSSTSGNFRSFEKRSSQMTDEEQRIATSSANLNKRIKKIEIGQEITKMMMKSAIILLVTITVIGAIILVLNVYSIISLNSFADFEKVGFTFMANNGLNNIIASGAIQKYRGSVLYNYGKYETYINQSMQIQSSNANIKLTLGTSPFQQNLKTLYYDNFCQIMRGIFNSTLSYEYEHICDQTNANWCEYLYKDLSEEGLVRRCKNFQSGQMMKGLENYNNFFLRQVLPFFNNIGTLTLQNVVEINDAYKLIDIIMLQVMNQWNDESNAMVADRKGNIAIIVVCVFISTILLNIICIEILVKNSLREKYEIFRLMHEHYIPEWIIIKQKIIKVKLIREGFMKE